MKNIKNVKQKFMYSDSFNFSLLWAFLPKFRISETVTQCKRFFEPNGGFPYRNQIKI